MAAAVPAQFLFTVNPDAGLVLGFTINRDGGLTPVPGSPFVVSDSPRLLAAVGKNLLVAGSTTLSAFAVDQKTGTITKTDSLGLRSVSNLVAQPSSPDMAFATTKTAGLEIRVLNGQIGTAPARSAMPSNSAVPKGLPAGNAVENGKAVVDVSGKFMYLLDSTAGEISAFRLQDGKLTPLSPSSYPAGHGASSLAVVVP